MPKREQGLTTPRPQIHGQPKIQGLFEGNISAYDIRIGRDQDPNRVGSVCYTRTRTYGGQDPNRGGTVCDIHTRNGGGLGPNREGSACYRSTHTGASQGPNHEGIAYGTGGRGPLPDALDIG